MTDTPAAQTTGLDPLHAAWLNGATAAVERVEAEADVARSIGAKEHVVVLRSLARAMRAEFDLPPNPENVDA